MGLASALSRSQEVGTITLPRPVSLGVDLSILATLGLLAYTTAKMFTLTNLLLDQFELGILAGINMFLLSYLVLIYSLRGDEK